MSSPTADASRIPPSPTPYDPSTLQQRIHREIVGISALSEFLAGLGTQGTISPPPDSTPNETTDSQGEMPRQEQKTEMIRIRLDDEFWVDMTPDQVTEFLRRKEASLQAVEERRGNLAQLQEWMIRELQDMPGLAPEATVDQEDASQDVPTEKEEINAKTDAVEAQTAIEEIADVPSPSAQEGAGLAKTTSAISSVQAPSQSSSLLAPTSDTAKKLDDINSALAKFGTSMEEVLKLDPQAGDGKGTSAEGVEVGNDGTVLNEEGLPFLDIREDPSAHLDTQQSTETPILNPTSTLPVDDYWSEEAIERRRRLREKLFADEDDDEEEEDDDDDEDEQEGDGRRGDPARIEDEQDVQLDAKPTPAQPPTKTTVLPTPAIPLPEPDTVTPDITKGKGKSVPPKRGFMARSLVIDHSQEEKEAENQIENATTQQTGSSVPAAPIEPLSVSDSVNPAAPRVASPSPSLKNPEAEGPASGERRKSVTFNPQTRVRLYEKGEIMPNASSTSSPVDTSSTASRFEVLPDEQEFDKVKEGSAVPASVAKQPATSASSTKSKDNFAFSGFNKGFLDRGPSKKQAGKPKHQGPVAPLLTAVPAPAKSSSTPNAGPAVVESPEYHQPLAPAHEKPPPPKKQSVFAQRKAEAQTKREQLMNFSSFDPFPTQPVGTGAAASTAKAIVPNSMKMAVVERPVAVARAPEKPKPAAGPIPTEPSPQQFPPAAKKPREAPEVTSENASVVQSGKQTAVQATVIERKPVTAPAKPETTATSRAETDLAVPHDSDSDSLADFEYSDGEDAFDMDEALLAREAALAYHAKRSALGRKGLGGWTGNIGPDGEVEWDTEIVPMSAGMEEAPPRTGAVAFGERILPPGFDGLRLPVGGEGDGDSSDDEDQATTTSDGFASISLPQVIPASENLASSIKIGKLENGNLVVQDTDDSDDEPSAPQAEESMTPDERLARDQAAEERRQRKAMIDRLRRGDVAEMIREEREQEDLFRASGGGYVEPAPEAPPALESAAEGAEWKTPSVSAAVSERKRLKGNSTVRQKDVVSADGIVPPKVEPPTDTVEAVPRKVSKFKAARMARSS